MDHEPCADVAGVAEFYRRLGALLALLYAVDGTDMHYENLIACGDQPVLVDVETLFHPTLTPDTDPAALALARSVHRTALLPHVLLGDNGAADVSGVGGDQGVLSPLDVVDWADAGTDRMRLVRRPRASTGALNRPLLGGVPAEPADYQDSLLAGFRTGYDAIVAHRDELLQLVRACADDEVRFVARATRQYARLLDESTHPVGAGRPVGPGSGVRGAGHRRPVARSAGSVRGGRSVAGRRATVHLPAGFARPLDRVRAPAAGDAAGARTARRRDARSPR